jgi:hypothetical protein
MKRLLAAALFTMLIAATFVSAQEAPPISTAQFQKMQKYLDTVGSKDTFPPPTAASLGLSSDVAQELPVVSIKTNDHTVYFCRSELNPADFIVWTRVAGDTDSSYMFSTHSDFKMIRALYLHTERFPQPIDIDSNEVRAVYKKALVALAKDIDSSPPPKE